MFNIENFPDIIIHLKSISRICRKNSSGWFEIFCPYCDDAHRKVNPNHGHFHIASDFPFGHCFRCDTKVGLDKFLIDTNFNNFEVIQKIQKFSKYIYHNFKSIKKEKKYDINILKQNIFKTHIDFSNNNLYQYNIFKNYLYSRCCDINIFNYNIIPTILNNFLGIQFLNYDGHIVTTRYIDNPNCRYNNPSDKKLYYFQDIENIYRYKNILICEGIFDLINLSNYLFDSKNTYFLAMGGSHYKKTIASIINSQLIIGDYNIHIVFDQNVKYINSVIYNVKKDINILNPNINCNFYIPQNTKDVSECMIIKAIGDE